MHTASREKYSSTKNPFLAFNGQERYEFRPSFFPDLFGKIELSEVEQLRIPYMGSKNKIASQLMTKMLEIKPRAKYFVDLFGGGASMSFLALQLGLKVHYNEKQTSLVNFIDYILKRIKKGRKGKFGLFPDDFYKFITRDKFNELKEKDSVKGQFARICYSFGNNQRDYLFGDVEKAKHLAHNIVMLQCKDSLKEFNEFYKSDIGLPVDKTWNERRLNFQKQIRDRRELAELERLEQLERLQQLAQLQPLNNLTLSNLDYKEVKIETPIDETIVYLDPPYRGTAKYIKDISHDEMDDYFKSSPYTCFMSEYEAPFKKIFQIEKRQLLDNSKDKATYALEKLYINRQ